MKFSPLLDSLIRELQILPGVGPKSAQRMAFQLLERERKRGLQLGQTLQKALTEIGHCQHCRTFTENTCVTFARTLNGRKTASFVLWKHRQMLPLLSKLISTQVVILS